jgi:T5orf172 domain
MSIWENRDTEDHYVYVMAHLSSEGECQSPCKIGISKNPVKRLKQVQRVEAGSLVLMARHCFWKREYAYAVEQEFHKVCGAYRLHGEWFDIEPQNAIGMLGVVLRKFSERELNIDNVSDWLAFADHVNIPDFMGDVLPHEAFEVAP